MNCLLVGCGELGNGVLEVFRPYHNIIEYDIKWTEKPEGSFEVLLVCFPYTNNFISNVLGYINEYNPKSTVIFSTVAVGTTSRIPNAVHSPVEGKHPFLGASVKAAKRFVGGRSKLAIKFFEEAGYSPVVLEKPEFTEFLKLQSTSNYGLMIEFARYVKSVCDNMGMDYEYVKSFNRAYNELYEQLDMYDYKRYILEPPQGNIGGHCIIPNAKILDEQYPSIFLKEIYRQK